MAFTRSVDPGDAPVRAARLYPSEAHVVRELVLDVPPGPLQLLVVVPASTPLGPIDARARLDPGGEVGVAAAEVVAVSRDAPAEDDAALVARRRAVERLAELGSRRLIESWASPEPPLEAWTEFFELYRAEQARLAERDARRSASTRQALGKRWARVQLGVAKSGRLHVELRHRVHEVGWRPVLEVHARTVGRRCEGEVLVVGEVRQQTGEDWLNTELALFGEPPAAPGPPPLPRLVLSGFQGPPLGSVGPERTSGPRPHPSSYSAVASVLADRGPTPVELARYRFSGPLVRSVSAEGPPVVMRLAQIVAAGPIPAAPARLFLDGAYLGEVPLGPASPGAELALPLGVEAGIRVSVQARRPPPGRSRGTNRLEHRFERTVWVEDAGCGGADLDVRVRLPVSASSEVEVEVEALPPGTEVDEATGFGTAVVRLPAGGQRELRFSFSVHAPRAVVVDDPPS